MTYWHQFTSESVSVGHPDKVADQISDAILDAALHLDADARVACEVLVKSDLVVVAGEISSGNFEDVINRIGVEKVVRRVIRDIGYNDPRAIFNADSCKVKLVLSEQSKNIADGIRVGKERGSNEAPQGAGDQGLMFGYATNETEALMPAPITYAHRLMQRQAEVRRSGVLPWLRPDAKSQVTFLYDEHGQIGGLDTVVLSTQHAQDIDEKTIYSGVRREIVEPVLGDYLSASGKVQIKINSAKHFVEGGPEADCGLTGRKIIVDTYGGMARHGGGAFSGKDPSKVDRSGAYAARYVAKHFVAAGFVDKCEIQISYAIGVSEPVSIGLDTFGTEKLPHAEIVGLIKKHFDLTPTGIIRMLDLKRPIYEKTAAHGHFGREDFAWEALDRLAVLQKAAGRA